MFGNWECPGKTNSNIYNAWAKIYYWYEKLELFKYIKIVLCYIWIRGRYKITETMNILFDTLLTWLIQPLIMKRNKSKWVYDVLMKNGMFGWLPLTFVQLYKNFDCISHFYCSDNLVIKILLFFELDWHRIICTNLSYFPINCLFQNNYILPMVWFIAMNAVNFFVFQHRNVS